MAIQVPTSPNASASTLPGEDTTNEILYFIHGSIITLKYRALIIFGLHFGHSG